MDKGILRVQHMFSPITNSGIKVDSGNNWAKGNMNWSQNSINFHKPLLLWVYYRNVLVSQEIVSLWSQCLPPPKLNYFLSTMQSHSSNDCRVRGLFYSLIFEMNKGPFSKRCDHPFFKGVQIYELGNGWKAVTLYWWFRSCLSLPTLEISFHLYKLNCNLQGHPPIWILRTPWSVSQHQRSLYINPFWALLQPCCPLW